MTPIPTNAEPAELIRAGELSQALETRLQEAGKRVLTEHLVKQMQVVERHRNLFQVDCLLLGLMLLAKKAELGHGNFQAWFGENFKRASAAHLNAEGTIISYRTAKIYMFLAKRFLSNLERGLFADEFRELVSHMEDPPSVVDAEAVVAWTEGSRQNPVILSAFLRAFVAGRSLRRMLRDFRQAEKDAGDLADGGEGAPEELEPPGGNESPEQLVFSFKYEWSAAIQKAEQLLWENHMDRRLAHLGKRDYLELYERLQAYTARLRNVIKEMER